MKNSTNEFLVKLNEVVLISSGGNLTQQMVSVPYTIYIIKDIFHINTEITIAAHCILDFRGGAIYGDNDESKLKGNITEIKAPNYQIFQDISLTGSFSNISFSAHWFVWCSGKRQQR